MVILILGKIDSGKSSYCTYLVNKLVNGKCRVAVLDGDLGQSDIGPSGNRGLRCNFQARDGIVRFKVGECFFYRCHFADMAIAKTIEGLTALKAQILERPVDFIVVNTDGWVTGEIAVKYKTELIKELKPDLIVGVPLGE